jgi:hypothetical protein
LEARVGIGPLSLDSWRNYPRFERESSLMSVTERNSA